MNQQTAQQIVGHNKEVYSQIADGFEQTRRAMHWQALTRFAEEITDNKRVLDIGCGTGRLLNYLKDKDIEYVGVDNVEELLVWIKQRLDRTGIRGQIKLGDILDIPEPDSSFDAVFAIAVLHHIPSKELRLKAMKEMTRVLKPGGQLYMTNWNIWYDKRILQLYWRKVLLFLFSIAHRNNVIDTNRIETLLKHLEWNDVLIPWKHQKSGRILQRYYHAFTKKELMRIVTRSGLFLENNKIDRSDSMYGGRGWNYVTIARKLNRKSA